MRNPFFKADKIAKFIGWLHQGKRVLWHHPKYVVMDIQSYEDLIRAKAEPYKLIHFDELTNFTDEDYQKLIKLLEKT